MKTANVTNVQNNETLLEVHDLSVDYGYGADATHAVRNIEIRLARGEFVGLVGESGSGKSTLGFAIAGLSKPPAHIEKGRILFGGKDIASLDAEALREQRHGGIAMVLQSGMNALNPVRANPSVDLPEPDSPTSPTNSPLASRNSTLRTAWVASAPYP